MKRKTKNFIHWCFHKVRDSASFRGAYQTLDHHLGSVFLHPQSKASCYLIHFSPDSIGTSWIDLSDSLIAYLLGLNRCTQFVYTFNEAFDLDIKTLTISICFDVRQVPTTEASPGLTSKSCQWWESDPDPCELHAFCESVAIINWTWLNVSIYYITAYSKPLFCPLISSQLSLLPAQRSFLGLKPIFW